MTDALEELRRDIWQQMRRLPDPAMAKRFKGARWALLKNPDDLTAAQAATLASVRRNGGAMWRGYQLKEAGREIFAGDLDADEVIEMVDRWCSRAQRSRLAPFVKAAATVRKHRDGIAAAVRHGLSNQQFESATIQIWPGSGGSTQTASSRLPIETESSRKQLVASRVGQEIEFKYGLRRGRGAHYVETDVPISRVRRVTNARGYEELEIIGDVPLRNAKFVCT